MAFWISYYFYHAREVNPLKILWRGQVTQHLKLASLHTVLDINTDVNLVAIADFYTIEVWPMAPSATLSVRITVPDPTWKSGEACNKGRQPRNQPRDHLHETQSTQPLKLAHRAVLASRTCFDTPTVCHYSIVLFISLTYMFCSLVDINKIISSYLLFPSSFIPHIYLLDWEWK